MCGIAHFYQLNRFPVVRVSFCCKSQQNVTKIWGECLFLADNVAFVCPFFGNELKGTLSFYLLYSWPHSFSFFGEVLRSQLICVPLSAASNLSAVTQVWHAIPRQEGYTNLRTLSGISRGKMCWVTALRNDPRA